MNEENLYRLFRERARGIGASHCDIMEHMETLSSFASRVRVAVEYGTRTGNSTVALARGLSLGKNRRLICFDQTFEELADEVKNAISDAGVSLELNVANTACVTCPKDAELVFIDTLHTYNHVRNELITIKHGPEYIIFHDVELNGWRGEDGGDGIMPAILEWLVNRAYLVRHYARNNNGLLVLEHQ